MTVDRSHLANLAIVAGLASLLVWYGAIDPGDPRWEGFDLHRYEAMREAAPHLARVRQPEAFRLAGPFLAALFGFRLVTSVALVGAAVLLFRWLRGEGVTDGGAAMAVLCFGLARGPVGQLVWDPYQAGDALGLAALLVALLAVQARRWRVFAAAVAVGLLARETPLLAIPPALVVDRRAYRFCWPAALVLVATRLLVPHEGGMSAVEAAWYFLPAKLAPELLLRVAGAFAPVVVIVLVDRRRAALRPEHWVLVAGTLASSFCGADVERLLLPMAPVVYLAVARVVEVWPQRARVALVACAGAGALHHEMGLLRLPGRGATLLVTLAATGAAALVALWARLEAPPRRADG
jgi:hypothetical protein